VIDRPAWIALRVTVPAILATFAAVIPSTVMFPFAKVLTAEPMTRFPAVMFCSSAPLREY